jgi:16S rRNA (uracil1498-N3)-methyltransferase
MRLTRVFVEQPLASGAELELDAATAGHVLRVLRLAAGDALTLFDGRGGEYQGEIVEIRRGVVRVQVGEHVPVESESPLAVTLVQGVSRGERMDWVVQKATELGVHTIVPVLTERSVVKLDARQNAAKHAHWRAVAVAACEQCGRNRVPVIARAVDLRDWFATQAGEGLRITLDTRASVPLSKLLPAQPVTLLIGPEGGLTYHEREAARGAGFEARALGPRVLRTETAAVAALSVIQAIAGDLSR